jgi:hypothetical protein
MSTNRFIKTIAGSALAASAISAALFGAGAANADSVDDTFVATLAQAGIPQIKPALEIASGHAVCQNLSEGATPGELIAAFNAKKVFATPQQNEAMIVASITAYCPQYLN